MLDLTQLARQMQGLGQHLAQEAAISQTRLERAHQAFRQALPRQASLVSLQQQWQSRMAFAAATPLEALDLRGAIAPPPSSHSILATDGSQIAPSHHEIAYCYLINIGRVLLHYGQGRQPLLDSLPEVFYQPEDLYAARRWGIGTEEWMGHRRTVLEIERLAELGAAFAGAQAGSGASPAAIASTTAAAAPLASPTPAPAPSLAMVDGSLIYWFLETLPVEAKALILPNILAAWQRLRDCGIPLVGYVSASRSRESLNFLRLQACPFGSPDCQSHCSSPSQNPTHSQNPSAATIAAAATIMGPIMGMGDRSEGQSEPAPCQIFTPLRDTALWATLLQPGERSPLWRSTARLLNDYGEAHHIYFCYVHVGVEVARLEFPAWVATDDALLAQTLSLTLAQVQKGYGYPIALAEAHNHAVVRSGDRQRFFLMLERQMMKAGLKNIGTSYKEARKRGSVV